MSEQAISSQTSKRKKKIIITVIITAVLLIIFALPIRMGIAHIHNKMILRSVRNDFVDAIEDIDGMTVTEVQSTKGKLSGNGNGMDYFVAVLVPALLCGGCRWDHGGAERQILQLCSDHGSDRAGDSIEIPRA